MTDTLDARRSLQDWLDAFSSDRPLPAGGHAASLTAAFAAALVEKVARIVRRSPARAALHELADEVITQATPLRAALLAIGAADDRAYALFIEKSRTADDAAHLAARIGAARTQSDLIIHAAAVAHLAAALEAKLGPALGADLAMARLLAGAAAHGAHGNVLANLGDLESAEAERMRLETGDAVASLPNPSSP